MFTYISCFSPKSYKTNFLSLSYYLPLRWGGIYGFYIKSRLSETLETKKESIKTESII